MAVRTYDLSRIEILVLDVDGVLTDGRLYVSDDGRESKAFSIQDGAGLKLWALAGGKAAIISGHASEGVRRRFLGLGLGPDDVVVGAAEKLPVFRAILRRHGLDPSQAAVMGDDVMDLPLFPGAGFRATVPAAHAEVLKAADFITAAPGGRGAVREIVDLLLKARGLYDAVLRRFQA